MMSFNFDDQEWYYRHMLELQEDKEREKLEKTAIPLQAIYNQLKLWSTQDKGSIYWITINPPPNIDIQGFINRVHQLRERSYLPNIKYSFEQRGEQLDEVGTGVHVHILCDKKKGVAPKNIINNLSSFLKNYISSSSSIDVKSYPKSYYQDKVNYLSGKKQDPDKDKKIEMDKIFRERFKLNSIY